MGQIVADFWTDSGPATDLIRSRSGPDPFQSPLLFGGECKALSSLRSKFPNVHVTLTAVVMTTAHSLDCCLSACSRRFKP